MFRRNNRVWRKGLVCKSSNIAFNQVIQQARWHNKKILIKGYSATRLFMDWKLQTEVDFRTNFYALRIANSILILHTKASFCQKEPYEILIKFQHDQIRTVLYNTVSISASFLIWSLSPESFNFNPSVFFLHNRNSISSD